MQIHKTVSEMQQAFSVLDSNCSDQREVFRLGFLEMKNLVEEVQDLAQSALNTANEAKMIAQRSGG